MIDGLTPLDEPTLRPPYSRALALDLGPKGIRVNVVSRAR